MITLSRQRLIAYGIIGVLVLILVGVLIYSQITQESDRATGVVTEEVARVGGLRADEASLPFTVDVLQNPNYRSINRSLLDSGRIPVAPPGTRGKPNPFGL